MTSCSLRCQPIAEVVRGDHNDLIHKSCFEIGGDKRKTTFVQTTTHDTVITPGDDRGKGKQKVIRLCHTQACWFGEKRLKVNKIVTRQT